MNPRPHHRRLVRFGIQISIALVLTACSSRVELLGNLPERDANEIVAALVNAGIGADKVSGKDGLVSVQVASARVASAVDTLRALGLPHEQFDGMGKVFRKDGLISSPTEERARYLYALSQDISSTLSHIDGVVYASVHLVLPESGSVATGDAPSASSAAVFIKYRSGAHVEILEPQVRRLVASSIPGLTPERVTVVMVRSTLLPPAQVLAVHAARRTDAGWMPNLRWILLALITVAAALALGAVLRRGRGLARVSEEDPS